MNFLEERPPQTHTRLNATVIITNQACRRLPGRHDASHDDTLPHLGVSRDLCQQSQGPFTYDVQKILLLVNTSNPVPIIYFFGDLNVDFICICLPLQRLCARPEGRQGLPELLLVPGLLPPELL